MLTLVYFSNVSGNTHRFLTRYTQATENTDEGAAKLLQLEMLGSSEQPTCHEDYILVTPTYGAKPGVPPQVKKFLNDETTRNHCVGVVGTGNINFGKDFGLAGDLVAAKLNIPLLMKIDFVGENKDIETLHRLVQLTGEEIREIADRNAALEQ